MSEKRLSGPQSIPWWRRFVRRWGLELAALGIFGVGWAALGLWSGIILVGSAAALWFGHVFVDDSPALQKPTSWEEFLEWLGVGLMALGVIGVAYAIFGIWGFIAVVGGVAVLAGVIGVWMLVSKDFRRVVSTGRLSRPKEDRGRLGRKDIKWLYGNRMTQEDFPNFEEFEAFCEDTERLQTYLRERAREAEFKSLNPRFMFENNADIRQDFATVEDFEALCQNKSEILAYLEERKRKASESMRPKPVYTEEELARFSQKFDELFGLHTDTPDEQKRLAGHAVKKETDQPD